MKPNNPSAESVKLPDSLLWLADAPLFIDEKLVGSFYDAVVQPQGEQMSTILEVSKEKVTKLSGTLGISAGASPSDLLTTLSHFLPFLKLEAKAEATGTAERDTSKGESRTIELRAIKTPQRQLVNLVLHYFVNQPGRIYLKGDPSDQAWREPAFVSDVPRALVFLDLPSQDEVNSKPDRLAEAKLIPTAAEYGNGSVILLYRQLKSPDGRQSPPTYPEHADSLEELKRNRRDYWRWFDENFDATQAMQIIESAAGANGRLRWIDFRLPISREGDTLHLHFSPSEAYDTGSFAYQLVKRGYKHGLRLVGTLKSEPDLNVLAVYEK